MVLGVFGSFFGFFRNFLQLITGKTNEHRKNLAKNPHVIEAKFEEAKKNKKDRANQLLDAISLIETESVKLEKRISEGEAKIAKLESLSKNAYSAAESRVNALGGDKDSALKDKEYNDAKAAYAKFNAEIAVLKETLGGADGKGGLKSQLERCRQEIQKYEIEHKKMIQDLQDLELRKGRVIANLRSAEAQEEIAKMTSGISDDVVENDIQELESIAQDMQSRANVINRLNSASTTSLEEKYSEIGANNEFDNMFQFKNSESNGSEDRETAKLPE